MATELSGTRGTLLGGVGAISAALGMLVVRYGFIGLMTPLPRLWSALLTGGAIGLLVSGVRVIRAARRSGVAIGPAALAAAAMLPLAAVVGVYALIDPFQRTDPSREELQPVALSGLEIALPAWDVSEDDAHWQFGIHRRDEPGGRDRFAEVRWALGDSMSVDEYAQIFGAEFRERTREATTVAGAPTETVLLEHAEQGKRVALTPFRCPDDPRGFYALSFLSLAHDELLTLHRRILATVRCVPATNAPAPVFPFFDPPPGSERVPSVSAVIHVGPQREVYSLMVGVPGREVLARMKETPALPRHALTTEFAIQQLELPAAPAGDESRPVWSGRARDEGGAPLRVALTAWHCPGPDLTFVGSYVGPEAIAEADALRVLLSARCP